MTSTAPAPVLQPFSALHHVTFRHTFETAHRLPHLMGKCASLHGHSWQVEVTVSAPSLTDHGTVVEFGRFKREMRAWLDGRLDHGTMLGADDPICDVLAACGTKLFVFGEDYPAAQWPTVEAVAELIAHQAMGWLDALKPGPDLSPGAAVTSVRVRETASNTAGWSQ